MSDGSIPGINPGPSADSAGNTQDIEVMTFHGDQYMIPALHVFGKCHLISEFEKISFIGEGSFGAVYKAKEKQTSKIVALKKLKFQKEESIPRSFPREANILQTLKHDNVIKFLGVAVGRSFDSTYIILEFCPYELSKVTDDELARIEINHAHIKCIMYQLFYGLKYLHENFILHRDLNVNNILFTENGILRIAGFGNCRPTSKDDLTPNPVSRGYSAPELLFGATKYSTAIDIWSAGCIFAELLLKRPLFKSDSDNNMISKLVDLLGSPNETRWPGFSHLPLTEKYELRAQPYNRLTFKFNNQPPTCIALLHKIFLYDPNRRITAGKCLVNSYFIDRPTACTPESLVALLKKPDEI
ncbi:cyclin-dependent kinase 10-like [Argiope bruennichi]|uniref:Cyclin-dependent kinase 10 like protein n=1 Tax=Argiope bruennichi TaxID=94029 RepID=A0A8T0F4C4_ARGBR|nr:cyclin-dependent kinase 10-like [Argiope bruennichi]KAF8785118.1 Cyclin-dependent kinase 10 like protein [Argiope bruennichi]